MTTTTNEAPLANDGSNVNDAAMADAAEAGDPIATLEAKLSEATALAEKQKDECV